MTTEPLDNPWWHALTTDHAPLAEAVGPARRYRPDVSPFYAVDRLDGEAWAALAALGGPGAAVLLARTEIPEPPDGWRQILALQGYQMTLDDPGPPPATPGAPTFRALTGDDVPAMLALVELAEPGPFLAGTIELGGYVGVHDGDRLVAMAGRRLSFPGRTEVSAVCTHPDARGRGLGAAVTHQVAAGIDADGDRALLHVAEDNHGARRLYERLGFTVRRALTFALLRTPDDLGDVP